MWLNQKISQLDQQGEIGRRDEDEPQIKIEKLEWTY